MARVFQVFQERGGSHRAVPSGVAWLALPAPWVWAAARKLWLPAALTAGADLLVVLLAPALLVFQPAALALLALIPRVITWWAGHAWVARSWEEQGIAYVGEVKARSVSDAISLVARHGGTIPPELRVSTTASPWAFPPPRWQPCWAVARLTVRAAFRYRLVVVLTFLLLGAVVVLPMIIKHDGSAQGFTQILLTYTLGVITALLSLVTLWLACGTLARDIDEAQMQVVATKPIPRWQVWLGKWLGIMLLNGMLLGTAAGAVYLLMQWRATQLPPEVQQVLRNNVLTARESLREPAPDLDAEVDRLLKDRLPELQARGADLREARAITLERIKAQLQVVPPDHFRRYRVEFPKGAGGVSDRQFFARVKFHTPTLSSRRPYQIQLQAGPPDTPDRVEAFRSLAAEAVHEIEFGNVKLDPEGYVVIDIANRSDTALIFPIEDGFEVLYTEGGFGLNYLRAIIVIGCWLGLLAAIGLWAASFLSFPVAAFLATTVLILGMSTGTLKSVVEDNTVLGLDHETNQPMYPALDFVMVPVFKFALDAITLVQQFSPINAVSSGRSITWIDVGRAIGLVVFFFGGIFAAIGMIAFTRRELATAQANH